MKKIRLKPQDIVILLKLLLMEKKEPWKFSDVAKDLSISTSEVFAAINRAKICNLFDPLTKRPKRNSLKEFVLHGIRYVFPAKPGEFCKGIPTAHSARPLSEMLIFNESDKYVWPAEDGDAEGIRVDPLYKSVPKAIKGSPRLYEILTLIDALRVGKAREREIAKNEIDKRISTA